MSKQRSPEVVVVTGSSGGVVPPSLFMSNLALMAPPSCCRCQ